ncbi:hypothetical protein [Sulfidibacter corallicola]|uniref:Uncharacterized protein n=1 Tax=Sulfidibacter corallicola TaxID=2818388 RepID=A0A8A4TM92_SULCO|nr:hypothetical protein [Sulfidibacter corallicola]QTD50587.1 hypothetical protein J3U87_33805 [Sulfidibacter corallicola]
MKIALFKEFSQTVVEPRFPIESGYLHALDRPLRLSTGFGEAARLINQLVIIMTNRRGSLLDYWVSKTKKG